MTRAHIRFSGSGLNLTRQAGAMQALVEAGITPSTIAGTSGGAIIGAAWASRLTPYEAQEVLLDMMPASKTVLDVEWNPLASSKKFGFIRGEKMQAALERHLSPLLKNTLYPFACFTTNLSTGRTATWSTEKTPDAALATVVMASARIPFLFQPMVDRQGEWHVDGGVTYNYPIDFQFEAQNQLHPTIGVCFNAGGGWKQVDMAKLPLFNKATTVMSAMMSALTKEHVHDALWARTIVLPGGDAFDFDKTRAEARRDFAVGREATARWLDANAKFIF